MVIGKQKSIYVAIHIETVSAVAPRPMCVVSPKAKIIAEASQKPNGNQISATDERNRRLTVPKPVFGW